MQKDEPLIHLVHPQLKKLVNILLLNIFKPEAIEVLKDKSLESIDVNELLLDQKNVYELKSI